jgi:sulfonate transport system permease protein
MNSAANGAAIATTTAATSSATGSANAALRLFDPRRWQWLGGLVPLTIFLLIWWAACDRGLFPPELLVPPQQVTATFLELIDSGELHDHLRASLHRLVVGVTIGAASGLAFGVAMALSRRIEIYTAPLFHVVRQVPSIALIPVLILLFGIGETFKILIVIKAAFFPVALAGYTAVLGLPKSYFEVARVYRLRPLVLFRKIILPATIPPVVTGIRIALGRSWGTLVAAELLAAEAGIGQMMELGRQMFRIDVVMVGVVVAGAIGFGLDRGLKLIEARLVRWQPTGLR